MIIFFPTRLSPTGGSSSFARKFAAGLKALSHSVAFERPQKYDLLLTNASCPLQHLLHAKARRVPIIHRLDGVYYPQSVADKQWRLHNFPLWLTRRLADHIIYQSGYSRHCAETFLGHIRTPYTLIYNGVDTGQFKPDGPAEPLRSNGNRHVFITVSRFRRPDQIDPLIDAFNVYRNRYHADCKLVIIGNFEGTVADRPQQLSQPRIIEFRGIVPNNKLPAYLRAADAFLFTHLNPPCPNNVIEALACGLPVCGVADGAMPELVSSGNSGELLPVQGNGFFSPRQLDPAAIAVTMHKIMQNRLHYSQAARQSALDRFTLDHMINQYLTVLTRLTPNL
ncbi:MAG: hypothetical protein COT71_02505 [Candidatus Andersenbacteria bacterium CG10_big_fil_rev_8_21_14_0_10_54_11]|uniref:Glycosyltransferase subfamily 4-like N-terminal domain-containing protein n=1 Tax=Candidatus Andersenbacteria bacterium CG10_big_fil_rev_8_21_14_0_10_54_11 TaxID=1974485 RepID=A0A2M6WZA4_9BACT|nr:MAG: hypothetical protein COT71_02505 [Candidatus Andersenbacteria bacterium CG10_big_fil_rev_8_21_14_0_10_54_11]